MIILKTNFPKVIHPDYWEFADAVIQQNESYWIGHKGDGHRDSEYNRILYSLLENPKAYILDIGCGHGECIEDFIRDGYNAIGIDGNPNYAKYSPIWKNIPDYLFRCDLGKPFRLEEDGELVLFDAITSWECFEHIRELDIDQLLCNIDIHSKNGTLLMLSIGKTQEGNHRTLKPREWWLEKLNKLNFVEKDLKFGDNLVRKLHGLTDYFFMIKG